MAKRDQDIEYLAVWMYTAASHLNQTESVRKVINFAMRNARGMYGDFTDDEPDDPDHIPVFVSRFAAAWDDLARDAKEKQYDLTPPGENNFVLLMPTVPQLEMLNKIQSRVLSACPDCQVWIKFGDYDRPVDYIAFIPPERVRYLDEREVIALRIEKGQLEARIQPYDFRACSSEHLVTISADIVARVEWLRSR